jgi:thymidine kinase
MKFISIMNNNVIMNSSIELIIGPVCSGKTTELIRRLKCAAAINQKCIYITHVNDNRPVEKVINNEESGLYSHLTKDQKALIYYAKKEDSLSDINKNNELTEYSLIGIDEGQFFNDLITYVDYFCRILGKRVIVAGLNGDYKRKCFGQIHFLLPLCDDILHLSAICVRCAKKGKMTKAPFSHRLTNSEEQIDVGGIDKYEPLCRKCYDEA